METFKDQRAAAVRADRAIVHQRSQRRDRPCFQFQVGRLILQRFENDSSHFVQVPTGTTTQKAVVPNFVQASR